MKDKEAIMPLRPRDDFHKLLFAQKEIKDLKEANKLLSIEIGKLKSELDELKDLDKITRLYSLYKDELKVLRSRLKDLRKENNNLYARLYKDISA